MNECFYVIGSNKELKANNIISKKFLGKTKVLEGDVPSPLHMPSGCPFRSRCKYATEQCAKERPELTDRGNGHMVACWNR